MTLKSCQRTTSELICLFEKRLPTEVSESDLLYVCLNIHIMADIKPFHLFLLPAHEAHLCVVRALTHWQSIAQIKEGFLFPRITSNDMIVEDSVMVSILFFCLADIVRTTTIQSAQIFLEMFRNNLLDVARDPWPYGTHSFRRGGCQYLACEKRWSLKTLCEWGGWSEDFTNLTIIKYLLAWNDDVLIPREDFLNPDRPPAVRCFSCGRTCYCA